MLLLMLRQFNYSLQNSLLFRMKFCSQSHILNNEPASLYQDQNKPPSTQVPTSDKQPTPSLPEQENYRHDIECFVLSNSSAPQEPVNYFHLQHDLSEHMRGILLCWLLEVHQKYRLMSETFFMTVRIIDNFLKNENVPRGKLQLVGVAALWISAKYTETYQVPKLKNLEQLCDNAYKGSDILAMEGKILEVIGFEILVQPSPLSHFELIKHHAQLSPRDYWLARYLLEASLFDLALQRFSPALLAFSLIFFLKKMRRYESFEETNLKEFCGANDHQVKTISRQLCGLWHRAEQQDSLSPLRVKYGQKQFYEVSKIRLTQRSK